MTLNPGSTTASNIVRTMQEIDQSAINNIGNLCLTNSSGVNEVKCTGGARTTVGTINQKSAVKNISNCVSNNSISNFQKAKIDLTVDQKATASQKNALAGILLALAAMFIGLAFATKFAGMLIIGIVISILVFLFAVFGVVFFVWYTHKNDVKLVSNDMCGDCGARVVDHLYENIPGDDPIKPSFRLDCIWYRTRN